ncbi:lysine 2,3-aminomutase YodO family protein [Alkaliphilus metalliredigens QYMF]|uniref:Lysine 2,3-aminomutase YodO family protein n=1 Tax=Alkaliphilus metalliredigens (strain QYMF) TaxID=293826 RepID=A6TRS1_ALKMQ|nr:glutamate 2,3-aminomutase [Alkaliphilus metalliredigens]ABR48889.1 lysine 2,3-aminomutase YodO family protein [Alkaliphilus metalliredigens QYMF]
MNHTDTTNSRQISIDRAKHLKLTIQDYLEIKDLIPKGLSRQVEIEAKKQKILSHFGATEDNWNDWQWQLSNRISDVDTLTKIIKLDDKEIEDIKKVGQEFRWSVSPYYTTLIDDNNKYCPIKLMAIPHGYEIANTKGDTDPMAEEFTNPAGSITRRYPDRLIINVTNECAMYCRHCQRRRNIGTNDLHTSREVLQESIDYIRDNPEIRDVLITGGDALTLSNSMLDWLLGELHAIPSVDYIRLGSRTLVTMPQRITDKLINILKKYPPIFINTHFNHPMEITEESKAACDRLSNAGIPLGNQAVLLNGINNNKFVMRLLNHELLKCRVRPYYIFHAKHVIGTSHFNTSVDDGIEIMEYLRGYTSGMAIPTYIINAPGGKGKTPILPQYLISRGSHSIKIRTWDGEVIDYPNHPTIPIEETLK